MFHLRQFTKTTKTNTNFLHTLVIASQTITPEILSTITAANKISPDNITLLLTNSNEETISQAKKLPITQITNASHESNEHSIAESITNTTLKIHKQNNFTHILTSATNEGKNIAPRVAAKLNTNQISEVMEIKSPSTFVRPMYAGNAIATVESEQDVNVLTVRATNFEKAEENESNNPTVNELTDAYDGEAALPKWENDEVAVSDRPDLGSAGTVVAGGRGMKNGENFEMLYTMADKLGAAVGASRAAVDAGFVPNDMQIGQTGKVVAPELYIAVGISGAIQHLAGMKDSKNIVCINKDPEAPIFQVSDYGLEADLFKAVPEMNEKL